MSPPNGDMASDQHHPTHELTGPRSYRAPGYFCQFVRGQIVQDVALLAARHAQVLILCSGGLSFRWWLCNISLLSSLHMPEYRYSSRFVPWDIPSVMLELVARDDAREKWRGIWQKVYLSVFPSSTQHPNTAYSGRITADQLI